MREVIGSTALHGLLADDFLSLQELALPACRLDTMMQMTFVHPALHRPPEYVRACAQNMYITKRIDHDQDKWTHDVRPLLTLSTPAGPG